MKNFIKYLLCSIIMTLAMGTLSFATSNIDLVDLAVESNKDIKKIENQIEKENTIRIQQQQIKADEKREKSQLEELVKIPQNEEKVNVKIVQKQAAPNITNEDMKMVNYITRRNPRTSKQDARYIVNAVNKYSAEFGVDKYIIYAMIQRESNFTPVCVTGRTHGLMQIHENTAPYLGIPMSKIYDIDSNIKAGTQYMGNNIKKYKDLTIAISAYAHGSGAVKAGRYSTKYANLVYNTKNQILSSIK